MNGCRDGLLPRESAWRARAKPWMMNNDSVAISPQEALRLQSALLQRKSGWQDPLNQGPNPIMARCGWGLLWDSARHHLLETGFIISSKLVQDVNLCFASRRKWTVRKSFLSEWGEQNSQRKDKLSTRISEKRWAREKRRGRKEEKKIKECVCKLTLTAQQGARVDRGERWSDLLTQAKDGKESKRREARETKQIQSSFPSRGKP